MKTFNAILVAALPTLAFGAPAPDLFAIKVGRAETASHGTIEHAVILVEDGAINYAGTRRIPGGTAVASDL